LAVPLDVLGLLLTAIGIASAAAAFIIKLYMQVRELEREDHNITNNPVLVKYREAEKRYATEFMKKELSDPWQKDDSSRFFH
jgi:hypothetical protein